ncbi:MAG: hypothetical protein WDO16_03215 [Bacteroidota bacterium]
MGQHSRYYITCEFEYKEVSYIAYICPYYELSDHEMRLYQITEYTYVVHLFSLEGFKTFEMFPDDQLCWTTNASSLLIDREIVSIIAYVLVNALR